MLSLRWSWILFFAGILMLVAKGLWTQRGLGRIYVKPEVHAAHPTHVIYRQVPDGTPGASLSLSRTIGLWLHAVLMLCVFSYLIRDNIFYKFAEAIIVGVSAGIAMVAGFWDSLVAQLMAELMPQLVRRWALPSLPAHKSADWTYLIPLVLGAMLLCRYIGPLRWLSKWPLAFVVGTFAGLRLILFLDADFISQIRSSIVPLIVLENGQFMFWSSLRNTVFIVCLISALVYFVFSIPHRGFIGVVARLGIWVLMITFGASFAFTVMGRITLLTRQFEFLLHDWLRLI